LRERTEDLRRNEIARAVAALDRGEDPKRVLEQFSRVLTNKFLHSPTSTLKEVGADERANLVNALARLYGIDNGK